MLMPFAVFILLVLELRIAAPELVVGHVAVDPVLLRDSSELRRPISLDCLAALADRRA